MSGKLSKAEKLRIKKRLELCMNQAESSILAMVSIIAESSDHRRVLRLKQALLSLKVEYNRIKMQYENEAS